MSSDTRRIGVGQLRAAARHYLRLAASGAPIPVMRRNKIVAQIQSLEQCRAESSARQTVAVIQLGAMGSLASHCLDMVAAGEIVEVVEGDRPVARIVPYPGDAEHGEDSRSSRHRVVGRDDRFGPSLIANRVPDSKHEIYLRETTLNSRPSPALPLDKHVDNVADSGSDGGELCKPRRALGKRIRRRGRYLVCDRCGACGPVGIFTLSEFGWECCAPDDLDVMTIQRSAIC